MSTEFDVHAPTPWRAQRVQRNAMKKQAATKSKKTTRAPKAEVTWFDRARSLPLGMFHTTLGPIVGRMEEVPGDNFNLRLWAPALVSLSFTPGADVVATVKMASAPYAVTFRPLAFVETYFDLSVTTPCGRTPVPEALVSPYDEYFDKVAAGEYVFSRLIVPVEQARPHDVKVEDPAESAPLPWMSGTDPHTWLTRKVLGLDEDEVIERDDPRRVRIKRAFFGWAHNATIQKVLEKFDFLEEVEVCRVYAMLDDMFPMEEKAMVKAFLYPRENEADATKLFDQANSAAGTDGQENDVS